MKTEIIDVKKFFDSGIKKAARLIDDGELVAFPTETVYGLGANGLDAIATKKIFEVKGRPQDNPLILHISDLDMLKKLTIDSLERAMPAIKAFWPGPLTIIFNKSKIIPNEVTAGLSTVAIRFPSNEIARALIREAKVPIAAPSANISGRPSPTDAKTCYEDLAGKINLILDGGNTNYGVESTVLDLTTKLPTIYRPGGITLEMLKKIYPNAVLDKAILSAKEKPKSPGQKYKHYAPKAEMFLVLGDSDRKKFLIEKYLAENKDKKIGLMLTEELFEKSDFNGNIKILGSVSDEVKIASNIFRFLREFDEEKMDVILCEGVEEKNLGTAIMNRLRKSSSNKILGE